MTKSDPKWKRVVGRGVYPVEYARWLLHPFRNFISSPPKIVRRLGLRPTDHVLEIGCGPGFFSPTIARYVEAGHLTLLDIQPGMIEIAITRLVQAGFSNVVAHIGSAESLPFRYETFDVVFMVTVLGEVENPGIAVREAARVLPPNGTFSVTEAAGDPDRVKETELNEFASQAGMKKDRVWKGFLIQTFNFRK